MKKDILKPANIFMLLFLLLFFLSGTPLIGQAVKTLTPIASSGVLKAFSGEYIRCEVTMGYATGSGRIIFGNPSSRKYISNNDFSFLIYVLGRQDIQFGKMSNIVVETSNFNDFLFRINWNNNRKDQGTISAEIQIFYSFTKSKYETYFINNSTSVFKIFWWSELDNSAKQQLNSILYSLFKKELDKIYAENERKRKVADSINYIRQREQFVRDSLFQIQQIELKARQRKLDSLNDIKKRIQDSLNLIKILEENRLAQIEQRRIDSINVIRKNIEAQEQLRAKKRQNIKLNYWGIFVGINRIVKTSDLVSGSAWRYISRDSIARNGSPIDGAGYGYGFVFSRRIASLFGFKFMFSEFKDGSYNINSESILYAQSSTKKYSLLKNSFFAVGPTLTAPLGKSNLDLSYLFAYSRSLFKEPKQSDILKHTSTSNGSIFGGGFRFSIGKGEYLEGKKISLGQLGIYYDIYRLNYKFNFGALPSYNSAITIRYINTIN